MGIYEWIAVGIIIFLLFSNGLAATESNKTLDRIQDRLASQPVQAASVQTEDVNEKRATVWAARFEGRVTGRSEEIRPQPSLGAGGESHRLPKLLPSQRLSGSRVRGPRRLVPQYTSRPNSAWINRMDPTG